MVGSLLTISTAANSAHSPTVSGATTSRRPAAATAAAAGHRSARGAGAGTPTKNSLANGQRCSASISVLNRASRSAMHTAKTSATTQPSRLPSSRQM